MKSQSQQDEILQKYIYKKDKPYFTSNNYSVWQAFQAQTNLAVTIKTLKFPHIELPKYLKKLKDLKSQYVIKIFQLCIEQSSILMITQQVTYNTLKKAISYCQHLDQNDSIYLARTLLNGHVDMLRADINWFGTQDDIQFTDSGLKFSWNNSCQFNLVNPLANIINKFVARVEASKGNSLLPFPEIKAINELIKISKQNASEISLHPQMKQKIKLPKKKGKDWFALRQTKNKNQYFDEIIYLAIHKQHGFVKVKIYQLGKISPNLIQWNKTSNAFTKILDVYDDGQKTVIVSKYSNDGNLENYIKRLKGCGIALKEEHIQFFFYSLFDPIKNIQQSSLKSINMLHIKNIYIENGIPKIGQPIPMNQKLNQILVDRADVPDFYHINFKKDPNSHSVNYDTYSIGVLLYKLMYTEYPIFPNAKVHIPTTPSYNKRLKTSLEIFLNQGGSLLQLEKKIEVSENVLKQVKQNKQKLIQGSGKQQKKKLMKKQEAGQQSQIAQTNSKISLAQQEQKKLQVISQSQSDDDDQVEGFCAVIYSKLKLKPAEKAKTIQPYLDSLEQSAFKKCRIWTKIIFTAILYIFIFFYGFLASATDWISTQNSLQLIPLTISGQTYSITTSNYYQFQNSFGATDQTISSLVKLGCGIDGYLGKPIYSATAYNNSNIWLSFLLCGLFTLILILLLKSIQLIMFDSIKALHLRQNGKGHFNLTNFIIFNLIFQTLIATHFYVFNLIYTGQASACVGYKNGIQYGSSHYLFADRTIFTNMYASVLISLFIFIIIYLICIQFNQKITYNKLINPVTIFGLGCFIFTLIVRLGAIYKDKYYPSAANDPTNILPGYFKRGQIVGIIGVLPELLLALEILLSIAIDLIYWLLFDKNQSLLSNDASIANDGLNDLV